jgi:hypothetical protein
MESLDNPARCSRAKPQIGVQGDPVEMRGTLYGDQHVWLLHAKNYGLADEGSYFVTRNPTPGTGLATIAALTAIVDTSPFIVIANDAPPESNKRLYIDYIRLICTAPGTAGTSLRYDVKVDKGSRYTSGSTLTSLPQNVNIDSGDGPVAKIFAGPLVAPAASVASRLLYGGLFKAAIPAANDVYQLNFGGSDHNSGALATFVTYNHGPLIIGPGMCALLHLWLPSQSAASSYEIEIGHAER